MADNSVSLTANLTRAPELRFTNSGMATASFGVAVNTRKKNQATGEWDDGDPQFYDVTCFGTLAENVSESLDRGQRVVLNGKLDFQSWETSDGDKRSKVAIIADSCGPDLRWATCTVTRNEKS